MRCHRRREGVRVDPREGVVILPFEMKELSAEEARGIDRFDQIPHVPTFTPDKDKRQAFGEKALFECIQEERVVLARLYRADAQDVPLAHQGVNDILVDFCHVILGLEIAAKA
jgi:hypothetical protein